MATVLKTGAFAVWMTNRTGAASIKGTIVTASRDYDSAIMIEDADNGYDAFGIIYQNGVLDGNQVLVIVAGIAEVLIQDGQAVAHGNLMRCSDTVDGRAIPVNIPPPPNQDQHFKEIGHCIESKASGTNVLAKCIVHFN